MTQPILKWAGGKQALVNTLIKYFPERFSCYYEPFIGGASVLLALQPEKAIASDLNGWLIDTYLAIKDDYKEVGNILDGMVNTKEEFTRIRAINPETLSLHQRAAHLIYLNKTCFRGLFRVNQKGQFNVPYGKYDRRYYDLDNFKAVSEYFAGVSIKCVDFEETLQGVTTEDFVYLDPPYYKQGRYADFDRYTKWKFRESDHSRLATLCRSLDQRGVRWAVSNSDTEFVRNLFDGYMMHPITNRREINLNSQDRNIQELLITNYRLD